MRVSGRANVMLAQGLSVALVCAFVVLSGAGFAGAQTVTLGPPLPTDSTSAAQMCGDTDCTYFSTASKAFDVQAPVAGTITSWSAELLVGTAELVVLQQGSGGTYTIVEESTPGIGPCDPASSVCFPPTGTVDTFATKLPIAKGQFIGIRLTESPNCGNDTPVDCSELSNVGLDPALNVGGNVDVFDPTPALNTPTVPSDVTNDLPFNVSAVEQEGAEQISGKVVTPFGDGLGGVTVNLTGTADAQTTTTSGGSYSFTGLAAGTYTVTPVAGNIPAGGDEFTPTECDGGTVAAESCNNIVLGAQQDDTENFTGAYTIKGTVRGLDGNPVSGATVQLVDTEQGSSHTLSATTNGQGEIVSSASSSSLGVQLAPGDVFASVGAVNGVDFYPVPGTATDPDCVPQNTSCHVNLNEDRTIEFAACVVPNPDGSPLPVQPSDPIPGAITVAPLEAVGCWKAQNATVGSPATIYTSTMPIRLDGIDVHATDPSQNTVFTLDTRRLQVTASGDSQLSIGGIPFTFVIAHLVLNYRGGSGPAGGNPVSISDIGGGSGPAGFGVNVFGLPLSIGTGGPTGFGLPLIETTGQTVINAGIQIPLNTRATWDFVKGKFQDGRKDAASIGAMGTITTTNRTGLTLAGCLSINDWKPFPDSDAEIDGIQICYDHSKGLWTGTGMFMLPGPLQRLARDVYVNATLQNVALTTTHQLQGYKVQSLEIEFDHLKSSTVTLSTGSDATEVRISGIPLGLGFFLQKLGAGWVNNLSSPQNPGSLLFSGALQSKYGTFGISDGPEVETDIDGIRDKLSLFRIDGKGAIIPPANPGDPFIYQVAGAATLARLTPFEFQLGNASVTYHASTTVPEGDLTLDAGVGIPLPGFLGGSIGANVHFTGQSDVPDGILLDGTGTITHNKFSANIEVLFDCSGAPPQGALFGCTHGVLVDCQKLSNGYTAGVTYDFTTGVLSPACDLASYHRPNITPASLGQASDAHATAVSGPIRLRLAPHLAATTLAVAGAGGAPRFRLAGPGLTVTVPAAGQPLITRRVVAGADSSNTTTYVTLVNPAGGTWRLTLLPGSAPVASIREADSQPRATVTATVAPDSCSDTAHYRVHPSPGERIALYAREATRNVFVGNLTHGSGRLPVQLFELLKGRGKLIAYVLRGTTPVGATTVTTFADAAINGSENVHGLHLRARTLTWAPACGAISYQVTVKRARRTTTATTSKPSLTLPAGSGRAAVTITSLDGGGTVLSTVRGTLG